MSERVPATLAAAVRASLRPVRPLPPPWQRALWLAPLAALTLVASSWVFSLRVDAGALGWMLTWGMSAAQTVVSLTLVALAFRDAVPGRSIAAPVVLLLAIAGLGFSAALTLRAWATSPTLIVPEQFAWVGRVCFTGTLLTALPLLAAAALLASRAFAVRPWSAGALYGLGAGLGADAGWRLFCHYSDPAHVFPTHTGGVAATMALGILVAHLTSRAQCQQDKKRGDAGM